MFSSRSNGVSKSTLGLLLSFGVETALIFTSSSVSPLRPLGDAPGLLTFQFHPELFDAGSVPRGLVPQLLKSLQHAKLIHDDVLFLVLKHPVWFAATMKRCSSTRSVSPRKYCSSHARPTGIHECKVLLHCACFGSSLDEAANLAPGERSQRSVPQCRP